jgi:hypothetical protein
MSIAVNLQRWNRLDSFGKPQPHPIDDALAVLYRAAMGANVSTTGHLARRAVG